SAGNSGNYPWYYIHAPSDAEKILCIGATDSLGFDAFFSSHGPSSDGRLKPSITCQGRRTYYPIQQDVIGRGSGTSFSAPLITGGMACAMQAIPNVDNQLWMGWVESASTQADHPDYHMGHGIPDLWWMVQKNAPNFYRLPNFQIQTLYPNPTQKQLNVVTTGAPVLGWHVTDNTGRILDSHSFSQTWTRNYLQLDVGALPTGSYHFTLITTEGQSTSIFVKDTE
ncbi:MAG: T9SS type A sorting domain-containing protein, partial [Bacteroidetes bacterium]|nr:T9SS type A sorting domain-containing protein [Bacteroidota bacterium]